MGVGVGVRERATAIVEDGFLVAVGLAGATVALSSNNCDMVSSGDGETRATSELEGVVVEVNGSTIGSGWQLTQARITQMVKNAFVKIVFFIKKATKVTKKTAAAG